VVVKPARIKMLPEDHRTRDNRTADYRTLDSDEHAAFSDLFTRLFSTKSRPPTIDELERAYLVWLLRFTFGNRTAASRLLGVSYPTIMKKIRDYEIDFKAFTRARRGA
jgi:transcriptional regulator of acetoin/glycerol metabolism